MLMFYPRTLLVLLLLLLPGASSATPFVIAGFGDSLTCDTCIDGSYLRLLDGFLPTPSPVIVDQGVTTQTTSQIFQRLDTWIDDGNSADLLILMGGTVDTYQAVGGFKNTAYDPVETLGNVESMVNLAMGESIPLLLLAPPPVMDPCGSANPSCAQVNARLEALSLDLEQLATDNGIPFIDLYATISADPRFANPQGAADSLYHSDGLHLQIGTGDTLIASTISPSVESLLYGDPGDPPPYGDPGDPPAGSAPVPEPNSVALFAMNALICAVSVRQRRRNRGVRVRQPA